MQKLFWMYLKRPRNSRIPLAISIWDKSGYSVLDKSGDSVLNSNRNILRNSCRRFRKAYTMELELGKFIIQAAISICGAFLAAHLAMKKFRSEKWWEKKAAAYAELVEALHTMKWPVGEHLDAEIESKDISQEESNRMWTEFRIARRNIWKIADSSTFLVSGEVSTAVREMERDLSRARNAQSWFEHLDEQYAAVNKCLERIKEIAKVDLGISNT